MSTETKHWRLFARDVLAQIAYLCDIPATKAKDRADEYLAGILRSVSNRSGPEIEAARRAIEAEAALSHERDVIKEQAQVIRDLTEALAKQKFENAELRKQIHPNDMGAGSLITEQKGTDTK